ncbi:phytase [Gilvimarinus agarilyticus]|uniref:phytase n=1 Tax=Reichenbachiella agariperforans TaxID=156994 RepID=UPI001C0913DE|nr:phytase [Reichenbachiella agariperforans]MBU2884901.1 phytase [Gilvimarinus agarilyticus]MBU2915000.1 phytase [Reichenbachiella agariperforans]
MQKYISILLLGLAAACSQPQSNTPPTAIQPKYITDPVNFDSDDPAIWMHPTDLSQSLILGTDKRENGEGGVFVFDLKGKEDSTRRITGIDRPNNVDIAYGFRIDSTTTVDVAVFSERGKNSIRVYSLPDMQPIDGGGIPVFEDSPSRDVMGVALYQRAADDSLFAIVSRKGENSPTDGYLYQYALTYQDSLVQGRLVRKFGQFSGGDGEIEAIAVDHQLGYVYYSDELFGIRKYHVDPAMGDEQLAVFGTDGFTEDREGISIYQSTDSTGYILVSDQQANAFRVFPREGTIDNPHDHPLVKSIPVSTHESDGSEVSHLAYNEDFPRGFFVAMSDNKTFQIYDWRDIEAALLDSK